ncbi:MAG: PQQ-dependent dehydrogenase, methanol/ethanol family [Burkholderiales bacterium]|jgi:alcohol dehydrogenase (cytochrome c)|nr:PQQ-dependent dehydrogenase, methanol/ethanol family [Burkholderiales bacterium]
MLPIRSSRRAAAPRLARLAIAVSLATTCGAGVSLAADVVHVPVTDDMLLNAQRESSNWLMAGRDYAGTRYSPLAKVNTKNVKRLVPVWNFSFGTLDAQNTTPLVVDGVMYVTGSHGRIFAVEAATGKELWSYAHPLPENIGKMMCCDVGNRGAAVYGSKVFYATPDAHVLALDRETGKVVWDVTVGDWTKAQTMTVAPLVVKGKVVVGMSGAEYPTRLWIDALDADTGKQVWRRYTIPAPGEPGSDTWGTTDADIWKYGGGSTWITGSYDPDLDTLYWSTGNPNPDWDGENRRGENLYTNSTLALNPDTGDIKFHYQYTPWDVWDYDGVNETILANIDGKKVWLHGDRNGFLYSIDRTNGKFDWAREISVVNWATGFTPDGKPIVDPDKVPSYEHKAVNVCPASEGGKWWNPMSYHPVNKTVVVPSREICADLLSGPSERVEGKYNLGLAEADWIKGYGQLVGFDAKSGEKLWTVKAPSPFTSGVLTTGGDLAFAGTPEGEFKAYDIRTGEELWSYQTGSGIVGSPITYTVNGRQYVAIPSGWGGWTGWATWGGKGGAPHLKNQRKGGTLFVFALVDK